jgi:type II secretory pathway pseudopilin PulG
MLRDLKNKADEGFASMVEVIVTTVVFIIAAAGILTTVSMLKPSTALSTKRVEAAYIARGIMDQLRKEVDAATWGNAASPLAPGTYNFPSGGYNITYIISEEPSSNLRRLTMNIVWPD